MTLRERLLEFFKAEPDGDEMTPMKGFYSKLEEALKVYGDGAGLAADHPLHALKALHKEMGNYISAGCGTAKSEEPPAEEPKAVEEPPKVEEPPVVEPVVEKVAVEDVEKADLKKRLAETEEVLKSEREARDLKDMIETLKSFSMISINPEQDAPIFKSLKDTNQPTFDRLMQILKGADATATATEVLTKDIGSPLPGDKSSSNTAWMRIEAEAEPLTKGENAVTKAQAIDIVMKRRPDLVKQHYAEQGV